MTVRTTALGAAAALALFGHAAVAEEPIKLDQDQMDQVTAGSFPRWVLNWDGDQWFTSRPSLYSLGQANASSQANAAASVTCPPLCILINDYTIQQPAASYFDFFRELGFGGGNLATF